MKRPAFQFYPADWIKDLGLKACSVGARGLWIEMLCLAHESEKYGYLVINGRPMSDAQIAASARAPTKFVIELESAGVFSRDATGTVYCRRMVRDERIRNARAEGGKLGGNPALMPDKDNVEVTDKVNLHANLRPTPSSSSSSSTSVEKSKAPSSNGAARHDDAARVLDFLNKKTGRHFRAGKATTGIIERRMADGATVGECKAVIMHRLRAWSGDDKTRDWLRPSTLFRASNFANYLGDVPPADLLNGD